MKDGLVFAVGVLVVLTTSVGLALGLVSLRYTIGNKRLENVGIEVVETAAFGRPVKVIDLEGDTCVYVPGASLVKINK